VAVTVSDAPNQLKADVYESPGGDAYVIEIPVPGIRPDEIVIEVTVDTITVKTDPRRPGPESERKYLQREQALRSLSRIFEFPMALDTDNVRATLEYGILRIRAPKAIAGRQRVIRVGQAA
jgi:HSP20 family protein